MAMPLVRIPTDRSPGAQPHPQSDIGMMYESESFSAGWSGEQRWRRPLWRSRFNANLDRSSLVSDLINNGGGRGQPDAAGSELDCAAKQQPRSVVRFGASQDSRRITTAVHLCSSKKCGELEPRAALPSAGCTPLDLRKPSTEYRQWSPSESSSAVYPTADDRPSPDSCPPPCGITNAKLPPRGGVRPLGVEGETRTARRNPSNLRLRFAGTKSVSLRLRCEPQRGVFSSLGLRSSITMTRVLLVNLRSTSDLGWT
ncbi:hypothetical protein CPLU01_09590 [Colletotrichum plurivorum]|uniref:Uncharacterized protein n=1 Tax=Colletotrichum plurivorum TaxID=2175906 RepID=A0A8H6K896_9PEZI|nr:hypothetical protein CPLU01_09590 [Colletotrichum plurivorum]